MFGPCSVKVKSPSKVCEIFNIAIILSIVAPIGIPLTVSALLTPVGVSSGIVRFKVPEFKVTEDLVVPPLVVSNSAGLVGQSTTVPSGVIIMAEGEAFTLTLVVAGSEVHPAVEVVVKVYVPECANIKPDLTAF